MLGDSAIAVHPKDDRYQHLIGKVCKHPFVDRDLPIIADDFVDREFGTGAVKITPAHDHNDYEVGVRHNLPFITCIGDDGLMTDACGQFAGLKRFDARKAVLDALKAKGLYRDMQDNPMIVPICSRSKDVIEPILKAQWYVKCDQMAKKAIDVVAKGSLKLIPDMHVATWNRWMEGSRDWCISRQLWWGHRIPAYFVSVDDPKIPPGDSADNNYWVSGRTEAEAMEKAVKKFNVPKEKITLTWDEDVLDTWFSSALFPFSIFGWPEQTTDFKSFFPGTLLETGHDIIFFWVARMVFFADELIGDLPFKEVFLHAMVRDAHGRKMSKTLGNVIDPVDVIHGVTLEELHKQLESGNLDPLEVETAKQGQKRDYPDGIPECGTDALRFALMAYTSQGRDINLDVLRVQGYRFFCNKIWQAVRFTLMQLGEEFTPDNEFKLTGSESSLDKWILSRLSSAVAACETAFSTYTFQQATTASYNFWLYELCDVYLEGLKPLMASDQEAEINAARQTLYTCVETALRLVSPFMPFLSEELWQRLPRRHPSSDAPSICVADYPDIRLYKFTDFALDERVNEAMIVIKTVRSLRSDYDLMGKVKADLFIECAQKSGVAELADLTGLIKTLASSEKVTVFSGGNEVTIPNGCAQLTISAKYKVYLALE
uniref:valine--tRNA ligase n=1 Tax=Plectus sambesii TaxID=2011161 RepID=A0A914XHA5_9BILA